MSAMEHEQCIAVAVRVRPLLSREVTAGSADCTAVNEALQCVSAGQRGSRFTYDAVFGPTCTQEQVYQSFVRQLVDSTFNGYNASLLAYGQTGSGKTFTMGTEDSQSYGLHTGMVPLVIRDLFEGIQQRTGSASFHVWAQFLEIYNEDVQDLLHPEIPSKAISIRDAGDGSVAVVGAGEVVVHSAQELRALLARGLAARVTACTQSNERSSRSHAIFTIFMKQRTPQSGPDATDSTSSAATSEVRTTKLHLVDLAGSERTKPNGSLGGVFGPYGIPYPGSGSTPLGMGVSGLSGRESMTLRGTRAMLAPAEAAALAQREVHGTRFKETVNINQGLLALGNVISALGDDRRKGGHVPYRESKLTRLLQDSLGGNSRTAMIACVSGADEALEETLNTLKYAHRARNIRNKPMVNSQLVAAPSPMHSAVQEVQLAVLKELVSWLLPPSTHCPSGASDTTSTDGDDMGSYGSSFKAMQDNAQPGRASPTAVLASLPVSELLQLDASNPAACLDVLGRMRNALSQSSSGAVWRMRHSCNTPLEGGRTDMPAPQQGASGSTINGGAEAALATCCRAIAGMLRGMAEVEAQGLMAPQARAHVMQALDGPTLKLLPSVRAMRESGSSIASGHAIGASAAAGGQDLAEQRASMEERHAWQEKQRSLEAELADCQEQLGAALDDLERDESIFQEQRVRMQALSAEAAQSQQALAHSQKQHDSVVSALRQELASVRERAERAEAVVARAGHGNGSLDCVDAAAGQASTHGMLHYAVHDSWGSETAIHGAAHSSASAGEVRGNISSSMYPASSSPDGLMTSQLHIKGASPARGVPPLVSLAVAVAAANASPTAVARYQGVEDDPASGCTTRRSSNPGNSMSLPAGVSLSGRVHASSASRLLLDEDEVMYHGVDEEMSIVSDADFAETQPGSRMPLAHSNRGVMQEHALQMRASYEAACQGLQAQLHALEDGIASREAHIATLSTSEREARSTAAAYAARVSELESAIRVREGEACQLRAALVCSEQQVDSVVGTEAAQREVQRLQYEIRLKDAMQQVVQLRQQLQHAADAQPSRPVSAAAGVASSALHASLGSVGAAPAHAAVARASILDGSTSSGGSMQAMHQELGTMRAQQADVRRQLAERTARHQRDSTTQPQQHAKPQGRSGVTTANAPAKGPATAKNGAAMSRRGSTPSAMVTLATSFSGGRHSPGRQSTNSPGRSNMASGRMKASMSPSRPTAAFASPAAAPSQRTPAPLPVSTGKSARAMASMSTSMSGQALSQQAGAGSGGGQRPRAQAEKVQQLIKGVPGSMGNDAVVMPVTKCQVMDVSQLRDVESCWALRPVPAKRGQGEQHRVDVFKAAEGSVPEQWVELQQRQHECEQLHAALVARSAARRQEAEVLAASLSRELAGLLAQLPEQRFYSPRSEASIGSVGGQGTRARSDHASASSSSAWAEVQQRIADVSHQRGKLQSMLQTSMLSAAEEQELTSLEQEAQQVADSLQSLAVQQHQDARQVQQEYHTHQQAQSTHASRGDCSQGGFSETWEAGQTGTLSNLLSMYMQEAEDLGPKEAEQSHSQDRLHNDLLQPEDCRQGQVEGINTASRETVSSLTDPWVRHEGRELGMDASTRMSCSSATSSSVSKILLGSHPLAGEDSLAQVASSRGGGSCAEAGENGDLEEWPSAADLAGWTHTTRGPGQRQSRPQGPLAPQQSIPSYHHPTATPGAAQQVIQTVQQRSNDVEDRDVFAEDSEGFEFAACGVDTGLQQIEEVQVTHELLGRGNSMAGSLDSMLQDAEEVCTAAQTAVAHSRENSAAVGAGSTGNAKPVARASRDPHNSASILDDFNVHVLHAAAIRKRAAAAGRSALSPPAALGMQRGPCMVSDILPELHSMAPGGSVRGGGRSRGSSSQQMRGSMSAHSTPTRHRGY